MKRRNFLKAASLAGVAGATGFPGLWIKGEGVATAADGDIPVGVLFSLTGTIAVVERSMHDAALLAIEEINAAGGVNGRKLRPVVEDPASDPATYADKIRGMILRDRCVSVFGGYTSASRKAVLPAVERRDNLFWYPTLYEGRECSQNVMYGGATPNQQQKELIPWLTENFGKRFYLIGSNYIYPKEENNVVKILLDRLGGEVVGEEYVPLGHSEFSSVISKFREAKPDVIFSTVVGDSVIALHRQYRNGGLDPEKMPMVSLTTSEVEVKAMGGEYAAGHFSSAPYFMNVDTPANNAFVDAYLSRYGKDKVTHFVSEAAYTQVYLFKQAAEKLDGEISAPAIRDAARGMEFDAPQGRVKVDAENLHTHVWPKINQWQASGQAKVVQQSAERVRPLPYWAYEDQECTRNGVVQV